MSAIDFMACLDLTHENTEAPKDPPQGTYTFNVAKVPQVILTKSGEWNIAEFAAQAVAAEDDVDPDDLEAFGDLAGINSRVSFMATTEEGMDNDRKKTLARIWNFVENVLGIDVEGMTLREALDASIGHHFTAQLVWEPRKDMPGEINIELKNPAPID